jgi:hypothetical protein
LVLLPAPGTVAACGMYGDPEALKQPRQEIGEHKFLRKTVM